jgi:hypothetical protein
MDDTSTFFRPYRFFASIAAMEILRFNDEMHKQKASGNYLIGDITIFYMDGQIHRTDGPAISNHSRVWWYLHDVGFTFTEWLELTPINKDHKLLLKLQYG